MVEVFHERAQRHAIVGGELAPFDLLLARASSCRIVPVEGSRIYNQPIVGEQVLARKVRLEGPPIFLELLLLLLQETWSR